MCDRKSLIQLKINNIVTTLIKAHQSSIHNGFSSGRSTLPTADNRDPPTRDELKKTGQPEGSKLKESRNNRADSRS